MLQLMTIILSILLLAFAAGYYNGLMDWIKKFNMDSVSWLNKWELDHDGKRIMVISNWYYFGLFKPEYEEKFPFSSTLLVFLTDDWHFKKWCMFLCYEFALSAVIIYYESLPWWCVLIGIVALKTVRGLGFTLKYDKK